MEVAISLNRLDIFTSSLLNWHKIILVIPLIAGIYISGDEALQALDQNGVILVIIVFAVSCAFITLILYSLSMLATATLYALRPGRLPGILGKHTYCITPDGFFEATDVNSGILAWNGIGTVRESCFGVIVQLKNMSCHFIPRRAFGSRAEQNSFATQIRAYMTEASAAHLK